MVGMTSGSAKMSPMRLSKTIARRCLTTSLITRSTPFACLSAILKTCLTPTRFVSSANKSEVRSLPKSEIIISVVP